MSQQPYTCPYCGATPASPPGSRVRITYGVLGTLALTWALVCILLAGTGLYNFAFAGVTFNEFMFVVWGTIIILFEITAAAALALAAWKWLEAASASS